MRENACAHALNISEGRRSVYEMAFGVESIMCDNWDNPEITENELMDLAVLSDLASKISKVKASIV